MTLRRKILVAVVSSVAIWLAIVAVRVAPVFTGPPLPAGATRLHIITEPPNLTLGCAVALLAPVRVATSGDELTLVTVGTDQTVQVVWPAGFAAWRLGDQAVIADPWGSIIGRSGDVLSNLGGGDGTDHAFHICPLGLP